MTETFGQLVQTKRTELGVSMRELARRVGVDVGYISKLEKEQAILNPSFLVTMRLAKELGIKTETLVKVFGIHEEMDSIINDSVGESIPKEREAVRRIFGTIIKITEKSDINSDDIGNLFKQIMQLQKERKKDKEKYFVINVVDKNYIKVLQSSVFEEKLNYLYHRALNLSEEDSFIIKGDIHMYPEKFTIEKLTLKQLYEICQKGANDNDPFDEYDELKNYLESILGL